MNFRLDGKETMPTEKVLTRFAHSGALNMLLSKLGMYKDDSDLTSSDYDTSKERKWRTSYHNPMAGNIVFVRSVLQILKQLYCIFILSIRSPRTIWLEALYI